MKLKAILPSLKQKKRYLAYEIVSEKEIGSYAIVRQGLMQGILSFLGELGTSEAGIILLDEKYNPRSQRGLIKVGNAGVDKLKAALATIKMVGKEKVAVKSVGVSGMLGKAEKKYLLDEQQGTKANKTEESGSHLRSR